MISRWIDKRFKKLYATLNGMEQAEILVPEETLFSCFSYKSGAIPQRRNFSNVVYISKQCI